MKTFSAIFVASTLAVIKSSFVSGSSGKEKGLFELSVVHYNDFHGRFEETNIVSGKCTNTECIGGFARLRYQILKMKNENPDLLLLDAGDNSQETMFYIIGKWNITQQFFNTLPIDAAVLGNHDFDDHIEGVVPFLKAVKYPIVVSNIDSSQEPSMNGLYNKSIIIERHGKKIGIIGVITSLTPFVSNTGKLKFLPESPSVNEEAERLVREEGVFTNIVLSHAGYDVDQQIAENSSDKISLIVGGHSHVFLYTGDNPPGPYIVEGPYPTIVQNKKGENVLIVQAAAYTKYLGNIMIFLDELGRVADYSGEPIFLNTTIPKDDTVTKNLFPWKTVVDKKAEIPVGSSLVPLTNRGCFYKECTLGNFVTDAMVFYFTDKATKDEWTYAPIAIINPGCLRTDLQKGNLTFADIVMAQPFANLVQAGEIEGRYIKDLFESTVKAFEPKLVHAGLKLLQVSGIKVVYNLTKPVDQRVESIKVRCLQCSVIKYEPLDYNKTYWIVGNSFLAKGGDSYFVFANHFRPMLDGLVDVEVLQKYMKYRSPVFVEEEERIIVYGTSDIRERKSNRLKYENYSQ